MEGVAYAERFALEHMQHCGAAVGNEIYTTGGACSSSEWLQIRASVLDRVLKVPEHTGAAIGCAILAASASCYGSLTEAAGHMVSYRKIIEPVHRLTAAYDQLYQRAFQAYKERYRVTV
ncbi:MAG: FGGY-family carbohydrate kinase [Blautia marasmi]